MLKIKKEEIQESEDLHPSVDAIPEIESKFLVSVNPPSASAKKSSKKSQQQQAETSVKKSKKAENLKPPPAKKKKKADENQEDDSDFGDVEVVPTTDHDDAKDLDNFASLNTKMEKKIDDVSYNDLVSIVIEEISLEGLDGITIEALWTRIADATSETLPLKKHVEILIWNIARSIDGVAFYELPEPRPPLVIFNRYKYFNWETGHVIEPDKYPPDIYPFSPITDKHLTNAPSTITSTVLGSCSTFTTRKEITEMARKLTLQEAEATFGSKLVMVADQSLRARALTSENADPTIKLTNVQYCILERIGRSRRLGEVTAGQNSLISFGDSKTLFYLRKKLMKHNFITKQSFCIKNKSSGNCVGLLFHLRRFFTEHKSKKQLMIEQIVDILKRKANFRIEYAELKKIVGIDTWIKGGMQKLIKTPDIKQFVQTDVVVPYRTMYPNATPKEWKRKNGPGEKGLRVLQLINPSVNVSAASKDDDQKDDSSDDEPIGDYPFNISIFNHTYNLIFETGSDGLSLKQLQRKLGLEFYLARSILSNMVKRNLVDTINVDIGRQHIIRYYARGFNNPEFRAKYTKEKEREEAAATPARESCDDEVLDFLSGVLKVDKECLKSPGLISPVEPPRKENPFQGQYNFIKDFRRENRMERYNASEKNRYKVDKLNQLATKEEVTASAIEARTDKQGKENYDGILRNLQLYFPMELSVRERRIEQMIFQLPNPSESFAATCSNVINNVEYISQSGNFARQYELGKSQLPQISLNSLKTSLTPSKFTEPRLLGSPNMICSVLQKYFFLEINRGYSIILTTFINLLADIKNKAKNKSLLFPIDFDSDDEYYAEGQNLDDWSMIVNTGDSHKPADDNMRVENLETDDFKRALIGNFENPSISIRKDLLHDQTVYSGASHGVKRLLPPSEEEANKRLRMIDDTAAPTEADAVPIEPPKIKINMNLFMGNKPIISSQTTDEDGVETIVLISTPPEKYAEIGTKYENKQLSERSLARANFIIEAVCREKMISDLSKLTGMLKSLERKSKCSGTIDKRSLDRLLQKLVVEGFVKMVKIILKYDSIIRIKNMICLPPVDVNSVVQSAIEQMKMSFFIYAKKKSSEALKLPEEASAENQDDDYNDVLSEMDALSTSPTQPLKYRYNRLAGKHYGYVPKFAKIKMLHEFVFYLVYNYDGEEVAKENVPKLLKQLSVRVDGLELNDLLPIYKKELSWKMFVPPLPKHKNWPEGWTLVCDIILRLPLSVFVKIFNITYVIPELMPFLNHPLKRHFLLKHVPPNIRNGFLKSRKYIFAIHELICYLCYLGLIQFGTQKLRDKDQQFFYLNRNAILYDTTPSDPGYHQVSMFEYQKLRFNFQTELDVEDYWSKMWSISINTRLGQRYSQLQKTITLQYIHSKPAMVEAMQPKTPEIAAANDVGYLPGDHLGACCLDSSTWVHVKRNWIWASHAKHSGKVDLSNIPVGIRKKHLDQIKIKPIKFRDLQKEISKKKLLKRQVVAEQGKTVVKKKILSKKKMTVYRKVLPRPPLIRKKLQRTDELDSKIMNKMGKTRSVWSEEEDIALALCKNSATFLCPNNKIKIVPHTVIRDVMHRLCPNKRKKPSTAYTRRYIKLVKSEDLEGKQKFLYSLDSDKFVQKYFSKFRSRLSDMTDEQVRVAFVYLASYATDHYKFSYRNQQRKLQESGCVDFLTSKDLDKFDRLMVAKDDDILYNEPSNVSDIKIDVIKSIIHCSLGWKSESSDLPLKLYRIYQNFSDQLLRSAITCMRDQQIISGKKTLTKHMNVTDVITVGGTQIHSSFTYSFKQITKYPDYIYPEANEFFEGVHKYKGSDKLVVKNFEQGHGMALSEMATKYKLILDFKIPNEIFVLDPAIEDHTELFAELATRYKLMLTKRSSTDESAGESSEKLQQKIETLGENVDETQLPSNISELAYLLTKGLFPERDDEEQLEKLQKHFLLTFPSSSFNFLDLHEEDAWYQDVLTGIATLSEKLLKMIETECTVINYLPEDHDFAESFRELGANMVDVETAKNIIAFAYEKGPFGAISDDVKNNFLNKDGNLNLCQIVSLLLKTKVIIRTGVTCLRFVHYKHTDDWTIHLEDQRLINEDEGNVLGMRMKPIPWIHINGTVNTKVLQNWLGIILSNCMSYPFLTFPALAKRFNFLKPVDIFYLTEYLQELGCIRLYVHVKVEKATLFSNPSFLNKRRANMLDDFGDIFVETDNMAAMKFGAYWNRSNTTVKTPFDEQ